MKTCSKCRQTKETSDFHKCAARSDGLQHRCKACLKDFNALRYAANRERICNQTKAWKQSQGDAYLAYCRRYNADHKEQCRATDAAWSKANPLRKRESSMGSFARRKGVCVEEVSYERILARDGLLCYLCGDPVNEETLGFDHVVPISRGGPHSEENIKVVHRICNHRKWAHTPEEVSHVFNR